MKRTIAYFILLFLLCSAVYSQSSYIDVVYLKNGSIIKGVILEQVPGKNLKLETTDKSIFVFDMAEVEKITRELPEKLAKRQNLNGLTKGYKPIVEIGLMANDNGPLHKIDFINAYQFNPYLSLGVGTGLRAYLVDFDDIYMPLFADLRVNFKDTRVSPYFSLGAGYSFNATDDFRGQGAMVQPTIGVRLNTGKVAFNWGLGYNMMETKDWYYVHDYNSSIYRKRNHTEHSLTLNFGITF